MSSLFFPLFLVFLAPAVGLCITQYVDFGANGVVEGQSELATPILDELFLLVFAGWTAFLLLTYGGLLKLGVHDIVTRTPATSGQHADEVLRLVYYGFVLLVMGGVGERVREQPWFLAVVAAYTALYTMVYELGRPYGIVLGTDLKRSRTSVAVVIISLVVCVMIYVSFCLTAARVSMSMFLAYFLVTLLTLAVHMVMLGCRRRFHVHHWYWGLLVAHTCVFRSDLSLVTQAMALAIYIHGAVCFGHEPLFATTCGRNEEK